MNKKLSIAILLAASSVFAAPAFAANAARSATTCASLPSHAQLLAALTASVKASAGGTNTTANTGEGFGFPMWATLVDASGRVCAVAKIGTTDPWLGSRVISAQKANTANAFSTNQISISTANLYSAVQPGGSLYGLQHSNPVNTLVAYRGAATAFGTATDPMVGLRVGGVNVFGGGLALYDTNKQVIGAIGVSGDTSCNDHNIAWELRQKLAALAGIVTSKLPGGVTAMGSVNTDNIQYRTITTAATANAPAVYATAATGWEQPGCAVSATQPVIGTMTN